MATIRNTIILKDRMTPVLNNIVNKTTKLIEVLASVDTLGDTALDGIQRDARALQRDVNNLNKSLDNTEQQTKQVAKSTASWSHIVTGVNQAYQILQSTINGIVNVAKLADEQTMINSRLRLITGSQERALELQNEITKSANRSRGVYTKTANAVSQLGLLATDAFSVNGVLNTKELVAFAEAVNKQFVISGTAGTKGADAAVLQLIQAMSSGVLRGDELRSIMEQAPIIAYTVSDYMTEMGKWGEVGTGKLRELAAEGIVTADIVKAAMLNSLEDIDEMYKEMPVTATQAFALVKNDFLESFRPVIARFTEFINSDSFSKWLSAAATSAKSLAAYVDRIFDKLGKLADSPGLVSFMRSLSFLLNVMGAVLQVAVSLTTFIIDNWQWIGPIVWGVVAAMVAYYGITKGIVLMEKLRQAAYLIGMAIQAKKAGITLFEAGATEVLKTSTKKYTAAQWAMNIAVHSFPGMWIVMAIIAIIAALYLVIGIINKVAGTTVSVTGIIVGVVMLAVAFVWNLLVGLINAIIELVFNLIQPILGVIEFILNAMNGGFNSFGDAVKNLLGQIISWFLSLGKVVTNIIDAIFGTNWTSGLNSLQDSVLKWGKNEKAITISREAPTIESLTGGKVGRWAYGDAWNTGYNFGSKIENSVKDGLGGLGDFDTDYLTEKMANELGYNDVLGPGVHLTDDVSITDEDIKLLKDVAQAEWVNKYTTLRPELNVTFGDVHETADAAKLLEVMEEMIEEAYASALTEG